MNYQELEKVVENTLFYGTGDEAYENWTLLCHTCQNLANYGNIEEANIVLSWILKHAQESKDWCECALQDGNIDDYDAVYGQFGELCQPAKIFKIFRREE